MVGSLFSKLKSSIEVFRTEATIDAIHIANSKISSVDFSKAEDAKQCFYLMSEQLVYITTVYRKINKKFFIKSQVDSWYESAIERVRLSYFATK